MSIKIKLLSIQTTNYSVIFIIVILPNRITTRGEMIMVMKYFNAHTVCELLFYFFYSHEKKDEVLKR